ncbi:MAG: hypothetical protein QGI86_02225 [Candidatus Poribacteria bacterium]|nr:hypothetical protein [Candidatus Poribacteria bacterium]MDP6747314.1 hypothetical protein [Candidatus Poribacteria bacterium]MDP6997325.1 hypothetical protein [Candidatus Poribacteria bacterium]
MINSQSVKNSALAESRGVGRYKRLKGTKEHVVVDTLGISLRGQVADTNVVDSQTASQLLSSVFFCRQTIQRIWADGD